KQLAYNKEHGITPRSVSRPVEEGLVSRLGGGKAAAVIIDAGGNFDVLEPRRELEEEMVEAANNLEFEKAALLRDQIRELKRGLGGAQPGTKPTSVAYPKAKRRK